jgi:hypothetical protein
MTNHDPATAVQKLLPHAEAQQEILRLLATAKCDVYQTRYDNCRHAVSFAYEALTEDAAKLQPLPPDPEAMNNDRSEWAAAALRHFQCTTGTDFEDALADLLGDLMHWCDRNAVHFDDELSRARMHYEAETMSEDTTASAATEGAPAACPCQSPIKSHHGDSPTTKIYKAEFFTAADYAFRNFEADTPEQALQLARQFYDDNLIELDFRSYEDNAGIDQIQIWDSGRGTLATWESDDFRLRQAAPELLAGLQWVVKNMSPYDLDKEGREQWAAINRAIAKAENGRQQ